MRLLFKQYFHISTLFMKTTGRGALRSGDVLDDYMTGAPKTHQSNIMHNRNLMALLGERSGNQSHYTSSSGDHEAVRPIVDGWFSGGLIQPLLNNAAQKPNSTG